MKHLRTASTKRLIATIIAVGAVAATGATIAIAANGGGPTPPPKPLANAVHDAASAPTVDGVTAQISFTNHLIDASSVQGSGPLLSGATGRVWVGNDRQVRLELQSENGDAQIVSDGDRFFVYDGSSNTVYRGDVPRDNARGERPKTDKVPSLSEIQKAINRIMRHANLSGATPSDVADQPTYTVRISPKHDGGLLGAGEVAWDAVRGVPLRAAVYAQGNSSPVLELKATGISYGPVAASNFDVSPPSDAKVVRLAVPDDSSGRGDGHAHGKPVTGLEAVGNAVRFPLVAPSKLAGLPRQEVRLLDWKGSPAALVTYGENLGGIAVIEQTAESAARQDRGPEGADPNGKATAQAERDQLELPKVSINGATGQELDTALGTIVTFKRDGVQYTVLGSVPPAAAEAAARDL